jgi:dihydroneopterin aldolase/2-amino-4-hydroxy-6-hydroxymethyldihydropteridine diphosphokinase
MNNVYLGLGSNIGVREKNIEKALDKLQAHPEISLIQLSKPYNTIAVSSYKQPNYINLALHITTILTPHELLSVTENIERAIGRTSKGLGDPRLIDIDILFFNDVIISTDELSIPHALAHERLFVLNPMNDIAPSLVHPILNQTIAELKSELNGY